MGQQTLIYSFVARGTVVLAEYTEFTGNFTTIAGQCLQKLPATNNRFTYNCDGHTFNYLVESGFTYCAVAVESVGRQLPIAFLERIKEDFNKRYGGGKAATANAKGLNKEFGPKLKEHMQYFVDHPEEMNKISKVKAQVNEVKGVMMENIEKVLDRGEKIELLVDKTENLRSQMAWLVIVISLVVVWVASLCKLLLESSSKTVASFPNGGSTCARKNVMLVIAHPDDETMFFTPTINYLTALGHNIHILCLSTGNADGMGNIRKEELYLASTVLKVPAQQVKVVDHPDIQDGFGKVWNSNLLAKIIDDEVHSNAIDLIITFDNFGVSGHCNHRDVHHGVRKQLEATSFKIDAWELVSTNILRKYSGPIDVWFSILHARRSVNGRMHCLLNKYPKKSYAAMAQHESQWVWFRKLFVPFSSYSYVNTLKKIK